MLDLSLNPEDVLPIKKSTPPPSLSDLGLTPYAQGALSLATHYIDVHLRGIHHNTPFLHPPQLHDLVKRAFDPSYNKQPELESDELALLYIVLALGSLRVDTFDNVSCSHHPLASHSSPNANGSFETSSLSSEDSHPSFGTGEVSLALFRYAVAEIDSVSASSETAVQALFLLHTYVSNTTMGRKSKDFVARAVMMAHETGLNSLVPPTHRSDQTPETGASKRRAMLYLYVYFSDV